MGLVRPKLSVPSEVMMLLRQLLILAAYVAVVEYDEVDRDSVD